LKKEAKAFAPSGGCWISTDLKCKSFLVLFFKKELLDLPFLYRLANSLSSLQ